MRVIDIYETYKLKYPKSVIIMQMGNFYEVINQDSIIIHILMNYKIKEFAGTVRVGFPIISIQKVKEKLNNAKINYVIFETKDSQKQLSFKKTFKSNQYQYYIEESNEIVEINTRIENIKNSLKKQASNTNILQILSRIEELL